MTDDQNPFPLMLFQEIIIEGFHIGFFCVVIAKWIDDLKRYFSSCKGFEGLLHIFGSGFCSQKWRMNDNIRIKSDNFFSGFLTFKFSFPLCSKWIIHALTFGFCMPHQEYFSSITLSLINFRIGFKELEDIF